MSVYNIFLDFHDIEGWYLLICIMLHATICIELSERTHLTNHISVKHGHIFKLSCAPSTVRPT